MRDFDDERHTQALDPEEREFRVGGREFRARASVRPEALTRFSVLLSEIRAAGRGESEPVPEDRMAAILDATIVECIEQDAAEWHDVRAQEEDAINGGTLWAVATFVTEAVAGRPLGQPSGSSGTPETRGEASTRGSSSPVDEELAVST